jgi:hypothetical protein
VQRNTSVAVSQKPVTRSIACIYRSRASIPCASPHLEQLPWLFRLDPELLLLFANWLSTAEVHALANCTPKEARNPENVFENEFFEREIAVE